MNPKVSIILPVYNGENFIARAIQSALEQTESAIEVIVVDDASTDDTAKIIRNFQDRRLKIFSNEKNRGVSYTRNHALRQAKGEWITPLDADDWYAPERIEKLLQTAHQKNADLVADDLYFIKDDQEKPAGTLFCVAKKGFAQIRTIDPVTFLDLDRQPSRWSPHLGLTKPLIKRSFLSKNRLNYNEKMRNCSDFYLYLNCLLHKARFLTIPEAYYFYRQARKGSLSTKHRLILLEQKYQAGLSLLEQQSVKQDSQILNAVVRFISTTKKDINYHKAVQPFKENNLLVGLSKILSDPHSLSLFMRNFPRMLQRRFLNYP